MNYPLGGAFNSRINLNLREDKGWTYGARSYFSSGDEELIKFARKFNDRKFAYYIEDFNKWTREKNDLSIHTALNYLDKIYPFLIRRLV